MSWARVTLSSRRCRSSRAISMSIVRWIRPDWSTAFRTAGTSCWGVKLAAERRTMKPSCKSRWWCSRDSTMSTRPCRAGYSLVSSRRASRLTRIAPTSTCRRSRCRASPLKRYSRASSSPDRTCSCMSSTACTTRRPRAAPRAVSSMRAVVHQEAATTNNNTASASPRPVAIVPTGDAAPTPRPPGSGPATPSRNDTVLSRRIDRRCSRTGPLVSGSRLVAPRFAADGIIRICRRSVPGGSVISTLPRDFRF